jgi:hypothetical protein
MNDGKKELLDLRRKLSITYWVILCLSTVMFGLGVTLLSVPLMAAWSGDVDLLTSVIAAGFGITDLGVLYLFKPVERLHELMGDMSQITMVINSFQTQIGLRLQEMNVEDRSSIGRAARYVEDAAAESARLVQAYFEEQSVVQ